jgi:hypothetical protein
MLADSLNFQNTDRVHKIQADILWTGAQTLERAVSLPAAVYTDAAFYQWEVDRILKRQWHLPGIWHGRFMNRSSRQN